MNKSCIYFAEYISVFLFFQKQGLNVCYLWHYQREITQRILNKNSVCVWGGWMMVRADLFGQTNKSTVKILLK